MIPERLRDLRARSEDICRRWETLLRVEPVSGPLANPDAMKHLIPATLDQVFGMLAKPARSPVSIMAAKAQVPKCECGHNPYLTYFIAAEQALVEAVILLESELPASERRQSDVAEMMYAVRRLARLEIDTFCGVCSHRCISPKCRHLEAVAQ
jgi:hypothetical protein